MDDGQKVSRFFQRMKEAQQDIGELYKAIEDLAVAGEADVLYQICIELDTSEGSTVVVAHSSAEHWLFWRDARI